MQKADIISSISGLANEKPSAHVVYAGMQAGSLSAASRNTTIFQISTINVLKFQPKLTKIKIYLTCRLD
jgi:hypothetical protein